MPDNPPLLVLTAAASQMIFAVNDSGKLMRVHFGAPLKNPQDALMQASSHRLAYPSSWDARMGEAAVSVIQPDGHVSLDPVYRSHSFSEPGQDHQLLEIKLADSVYPVDITLFILSHTKTNVYELWAEIANNGNSPATIAQASSACLHIEGQDYHITTFRGTWAGESLMREERLERGNTLEASSATGTRTAQDGTPGFIISPDGKAEEDSGRIYMGVLAWSGNYRLRFKHEAGNYRTSPCLMVTGGADMLQSPYTLDAGLSLPLPKLVLTYSNEGKGEASRQLHRWARTHGIRGGGELRPTLLNSWEGAYFNFNEDVLRQMMKNAADIGIELFVLDDGWFANKYPRDHDRAGLGDWQVNQSKLPHGIEGLTRTAGEAGVRFGLWIEPEMINPQSELFETHPDWVIQLPGRPLRAERHQFVLDLGNPSVRDYIAGVIDNILSGNPGISYIKWDCNRTISDPGSSCLPPDRRRNLHVDYVRGYYSLLEEITAKHPGVAIQNCGSGGGRADYGSMKYHHEFWVSDNTDPCERVVMQWSIGHLFPAISMASHVTESPNHQTKRQTPLKFRFDVAMSARLGFELQPGRLTEQDMQYCKTALSEYKRIRPIVQFGDLYRLRSPLSSRDAALMYVREENGKTKAIVFVYLLDRLFADSPAPVRLKGLKKDRLYLIRELNQDEPGDVTSLNNRTAGGDYLMETGIKMIWKRTIQSAVLEITEI